MSVAIGGVTGVITIGIAADAMGGVVRGAMGGVARGATHVFINGTTPRRTSPDAAAPSQHPPDPPGSDPTRDAGHFMR
jgi:hypothetical protein